MKTIFTLALLSVFLFGCRGEKSIPREPPNIIILLIDSLRPDSLMDYGNIRQTNPFLSKFGKKGIRFTQAYSQSSHTKISIASIFTGLYPPQHQVRRAYFPITNKEDPFSDSLSTDIVTLAEIFKKNNYTTAAFVTNPHIRSFFGFSQGFVDFNYYDWQSSNARSVNRAVIKWLKKNSREPFFLYVHYMDVHTPYNPPLKYRFFYTQKKNSRLIPFNGPIHRDVSKEHITYTRALYEAQINYWDDNFRKFIKNLEKGGWTQNTIFIILSDHGEEFYEHKGFGHGVTIYQEQLKVPLYLIFEGSIQSNQIRKDPVRLIDILPTVCTLADRDVSQLELQGTDFLSSKKKNEKPMTTYAETFQGKIPRSIQTIKFKLIYNTEEKKYEFYDLLKDKEEKNNLSGKGLPEETSLRSKLEKILEAENIKIKAKKKKLDKKTLEQLKALGYIK